MHVLFVTLHIWHNSRYPHTAACCQANIESPHEHVHKAHNQKDHNHNCPQLNPNHTKQLHPVSILSNIPCCLTHPHNHSNLQPIYPANRTPSLLCQLSHFFRNHNVHHECYPLVGNSPVFRRLAKVSAKLRSGSFCCSVVKMMPA